MIDLIKFESLNINDKTEFIKVNDNLKFIIRIQKVFRRFHTCLKLRKLSDKMTLEIVDELLNKYNDNLLFIEKINNKLSKKKCRNENFPSHISENIVKFAIFNKYKIMPCWDTHKGDLIILNKNIEVKGFMSDGPSSFGPFESWDWIYFIDCIDCRNKHFIVYEIKLSNINPIWRNVIISKKSGSYGKIANENKRGQLRGSFYTIFYPQLKNYCSIIFNGTINELKFYIK